MDWIDRPVGCGAPLCSCAHGSRPKAPRRGMEYIGTLNIGQQSLGSQRSAPVGFLPRPHRSAAATPPLPLQFLSQSKTASPGTQNLKMLFKNLTGTMGTKTWLLTTICPRKADRFRGHQILHVPTTNLPASSCLQTESITPPLPSLPNPLHSLPIVRHHNIQSTAHRHRQLHVDISTGFCLQGVRLPHHLFANHLWRAPLPLTRIALCVL